MVIMTKNLGVSVVSDSLGTFVTRVVCLKKLNMLENFPISRSQSGRKYAGIPTFLVA